MEQRPKFSLWLTLTTLILVAFYTIGASAASNGLCPPLGAVLPPATSPSSHLVVQSASKALRETLGNFTASFKQTAVAFGVQSIREAKPLIEYYYTPPELDPRGVQKIDSDSVFRLASTSKLFPVLAVLQTHGMSLDDPITDYLPELNALNNQARAQNAIWTVDWDDITLGALASHLGGPADCELAQPGYGISHLLS
jgi:CubicO group peptidase (beta-lactamase class C family)